MHFHIAIRAGAIAILAVLSIAGSANSEGLTVVVPGMGDGANDGWVGISSVVSPTKDRWVIRQKGAKQYGTLSHVDRSRIIEIRQDASRQEVEAQIAPILASKNTTVIVDMNLPVAMGERTWSKPTNWASGIVNVLSNDYVDKHPKAQTTLLAHSAGTEVAAFPSANTASGRERPLFNQMYLLSPRRLENVEYPRGAILVFADGDFYASPGGRLGASTVLRTYGEKDAQKYREQGYTVVRIENDTGSHNHAMAIASRSVVAIAMEARKSWQAHTESADMSYPDRKILLYSPQAKAPVVLNTPSVGRALKEVSNVPLSDPKATERIQERIRSKEPTPGLGGVSLNAIASMPFEPSEVVRVRVSAKPPGFVFQMRDGATVTLSTAFPLDVLRQCYEVAYKRGERAELSIGQSTTVDPYGRRVSNIPPPGNSSVYYFGGIEGTPMGYALYEADMLLGRLAFGSSKQALAIAKEIPGFHTLAEMFPEKYTDNLGAGRHTGNDERIFITSTYVDVVESARRSDIEIGETSFAVRFARMGAAETAFSSFLQSNFIAIGETASGAALGRLLPYAQGMAIFRWIREHGIELDTAEISGLRISRALTLSYTPATAGPKLEEIRAQAPIMTFGPHGPTQVISSNGGVTQFSYRNGALASITRPGGDSFTVHRDDLGVAIALEDDTGSAAFLADQNLGYVMARQVNLQGSGAQVRVGLQRDSTFIPISNAEPIVADRAMRFAIEGGRR